MPQCQQIGKDTVCFATKEELSEPSKVTLPPPEQPAGLILDNGEINWNCPCLGGMATGPCGVEFRTAFSCFHYSESEPKGSECLEAFQAMQDCMKKYPTLYKQSDGDDESDMPGLENMADAEMDEGGESHISGSERKNIETNRNIEDSITQKAIEK